MSFETAWLPNLLGFAGVALNGVWPFLRTRTAMLWVQALAAFGFCAHYVLLGAWTGAVMAFLAGAQAVVAIPLGTRKGFRITYIAILPIIAGALFLTWHGVASLFAAAAMALTSVGRYQLNEIHFRALLLACVPFWNGHNLIVGSIPGLTSDVLSFAAGAWMLYVVIRRTRLARLEPAG